MARDSRLNIRMASRLKEKLKQCAEAEGLSVSEMVTDWVKQLPEPCKGLSLDDEKDPE